MRSVVRFLIVSFEVGVAMVVMMFRKFSRVEKAESLQPFLTRVRSCGL